MLQKLEYVLAWWATWHMYMHAEFTCTSELPFASLERVLNWLPVRDQLYFRDAVLAFKCMSGLAPVYLSDKLITRGTVSKRKLETRAGLFKVRLS